MFSFSFLVNCAGVAPRPSPSSFRSASACSRCSCAFATAAISASVCFATGSTDPGAVLIIVPPGVVGLFSPCESVILVMLGPPTRCAGAEHPAHSLTLGSWLKCIHDSHAQPSSALPLSAIFFCRSAFSAARCLSRARASTSASILASLSPISFRSSITSIGCTSKIKRLPTALNVCESARSSSSLRLLARDFSVTLTFFFCSSCRCLFSSAFSKSVGMSPAAAFAAAADCCL